MRKNNSKPTSPPSEWAILRGWILYDGTCGLCSQTARRWRDRLLRTGFVFVSSIDENSRRSRNGLLPLELTEMKVITVAGHTLGGSRALAEIAKHLWWAWPLSLLPRNPITKPWADAVYRFIAAHRHRVSRWLGYEACTDACGIHRG